MSQPVRFLRSNLVETPIVAGWLKPVILVPAGLFLQIHPRELEIIIAHELIHIRRYDPLVNLAQSAMEILFFYHPCIWWMSAHDPERARIRGGCPRCWKYLTILT